VLCASWIGIPLIYGHGGTRGVIEGPGEFGEMSGAANALFAGLAFAAVVITLLFQREDVVAGQKITVAGFLFDYYNKKISSLRNGIVRDQRDPSRAEYVKKLKTELKILLAKHGELRSALEKLYGIDFPQEESHTE
jgi:hypothetical protein